MVQVKNRFHHSSSSVQSFFKEYTSINMDYADIELSIMGLWSFKNCIPRTVILHEKIDENKNMTYDYADPATYGVLFELKSFNEHLPTDWTNHELRHALETKVDVWIIDAEVSDDDAGAFAYDIRN